MGVSKNGAPADTKVVGSGTVATSERTVSAFGTGVSATRRFDGEIRYMRMYLGLAFEDADIAELLYSTRDD